MKFDVEIAAYGTWWHEDIDAEDEEEARDIALTNAREWFIEGIHDSDFTVESVTEVVDAS